jgi:capsid protein
MNLKTDIIKIITGKFFKWVIGSGLKLQCEIDEQVLELCGVKLDSEKINSFKKSSEALFSTYAASKYSDYHKRDWLHKKAQEAYKTAFLGGDCLCVIRVDKYGPNIQVIDGQKVETPFDPKGKADGNIIRHGIEMNAKGEHVAFWVSALKDDDGFKGKIEHQRILAKNSNGNLMAWLIYGNKERIDHYRGIPMIASILEKVAKLDRFVEASVSKAEQTANVVYAFQHDLDGSGENILTKSLMSRDPETDETTESAYEKSGRTANQLRQMTSATAMNLPPGAKLISLSNPNETTFNEFFRAVFVGICASIDIPEEVALQKYEQNYSSSRAAINGWEHIVEISRHDFAKNFYEPFYRVWLEYQISTYKIKSPEFLKSKNKNDFMALEAFYKTRFTGKKMPHIDPLKEAKAIRAMLGDDKTALISFEQAAEGLGAGDWMQNYKKFLEERTNIPKELQHDTKQDDKPVPGVEPKSET